MNAWPLAVDLVKRCLKAGVREYVVCAGARNAVLIEALVRAEEAGKLKLWRHFEERSAGFFALGRTMETGEPCAVVTTSGTAVAELLPAMIEGYYQSRPLIAITADRPASYRGTGSPQAIDQVGIFGPHAYVGELSSWSGKEPLHLNIELEEEFERDQETFASCEVGAFVPHEEKPRVAELARWLRSDVYQGMVVFIGGLEPEEQEEVFHFCKDLGAPVVADATSGLREALHALHLADADRVLKRKKPGKILRLGDVPTGRFWRDLESCPEISVWSVCRNGLPGLARETHVLKGSLARIIPALGEIEEVGDVFDLWVNVPKKAARIEELLERYPDSEPSWIRALSHYACISDGVFLGNSMPVREWNLFAQWTRPVRQVRANRGANGIDGQMSTWLGWSVEFENSWAILGDLTAMYDLAAPFIVPQMDASKKRVLAVVQNVGGKIFERLPRLKHMADKSVDCMINAHEADFAGIATLWGMRHLRVTCIDDLDQLDGDSASQTVTLLEVMPDDKQTAAFWADWDAFDG
jgi:2-succinyl-5-enolpyruvyl-6-hydroxy-3-cyclohexene-1-carboxylate synthase